MKIEDFIEKDQSHEHNYVQTKGSRIFLEEIKSKKMMNDDKK